MNLTTDPSRPSKPKRPRFRSFAVTVAHSVIFRVEGLGINQHDAVKQLRDLYYHEEAGLPDFPYHHSIWEGERLVATFTAEPGQKRPQLVMFDGSKPRIVEIKP